MIGPIRRRAFMIDGGSPTPVELRLFVVGDRSPKGDVRAGKYTLLNLSTMKQLVATQEEVTDENKEYGGPIIWSLSGNNGSLENGSGSETFLTMSSSGSFTLTASVNGVTATASITGTYQQATYTIRDFSDFEEICDLVNNQTESTITIPLNTGVSYTPVNGEGFLNATFRFGADIDCNQSNAGLGQNKYNQLRTFQGNLDGAWYKMYNIGGTSGTPGSNANGGRMGRFLVELCRNTEVRNMYLYGSITSNSYDRGFGGVICVGFGSCSIRNVYCGVNIDSPMYSSAAAMYGWRAGSGDTVYINNCVVGGTISGYSYICPFSADATGSVVYDSISIADINSNYGLRNSISVYLGATCESFRRCAFLCNCKAQKTSGSYSSVTFYVNSKATYDCYEASDFSQASVSKAWNTSSGSVSNCYSLNSLSRATAENKAQLQSGSLFNNVSWLEVEGYYPLPNNNPFLTEAAILAKIR